MDGSCSCKRFSCGELECHSACASLKTMSLEVYGDTFWEDREIRFDTLLTDLDLIRGEIEIDSINSVEDTKGNNGERGALSCTNLRIIWISHKNAKINLSIGYNSILNTSIRMANSRLRGNSEALFIMAKYNNTRFEFIFTSLIKKSPRLFTTVQSIFRSYETSKLYRDLKLRGYIIKDKNLILLPDENILDRINGIWNLSSEQGNLGTFIITNIRIIWFANLAENFNVSIPYLQIKMITKRNSKFGIALVIETTQLSGSYVLGFRIDPQSKLQLIKDEIYKLWKVYSKNPIFGVKFDQKKKTLPIEKVKIKHQPDKVKIIQNDDVDFGFNIAKYYADVDKKQDIGITFNPEIGLAIETIPNKKITMKKLWNVVTQ